MKIVDCFTFFNELDLLQIRFEELYSRVDKFILVEAELTQSLIPKPLYFEQNKDRYSKFLDKVIHVKMPASKCPNNKNNIWEMENAQRNYMLNGISMCDLKNDDIILISDLDEIPNGKVISELPAIFKSNDLRACSFEMDFYAYFLNLKAKSRNWIGTVACEYFTFSKYDPQYLRNRKDFLPIIPEAGWHFSWLGGYEKIHEKTKSCIEPFDKGKLPTLDEFKSFFENFKNSDRKFFIHLENLSKKETEFHKVDLNSSIPETILSNQEKYRSMIL